MKTVLKRGIAVVLVICMALAFNTVAFAGDKEKPNGESNTPTLGATRIGGNYIDIITPADNSVYYQGETISYYFKSYDTWVYYYTRPFVVFMNAGTSKSYYSYMFMGTYDYVTPDSYDYYRGSINTKNVPTGKYNFGVMNCAFASKTSTYYTDMGNEPILQYDIKINKLKAPASVKATAGSKKVRIQFSNATGAQKYYIYRATSANGKYKKIGSTKNLTYTDTSVSKGKTYYYKVKSVRTKNGTITSAYSKSAKSGKVK